MAQGNDNSGFVGGEMFTSPEDFGSLLEEYGNPGPSDIMPADEAMRIFGEARKVAEYRQAEEVRDLGRTLHSLKNSLNMRSLADLELLSQQSGLSPSVVDDDPAFARKKIESDSYARNIEVALGDLAPDMKTLAYFKDADALTQMALANDTNIMALEKEILAKHQGFWDTGHIARAVSSWEYNMLSREKRELLAKEINGGTLTPEEEERIHTISLAEEYAARRYDKMPLGEQAVWGTVGNLGAPMLGAAYGGAQAVASPAGLTAIGGGAMTGAVLGGGALSAPGAVAGALAGAKAAFATGSLLDIARQEGAGLYDTLREMTDDSGNRIDRGVAKTLSVLYGGLASGLEVGGMYALGKVFPAVERLLNKEAAMTTLAFLQKNPSFLAKVMHGGWRAARGVGAEVTTEVLQEALAIVAENAGLSTSNVNIALTGLEGGAARLLDTSVETLKSMLIPGAVGAGARIAHSQRAQGQLDNMMHQFATFQGNMLDSIAKAAQQSTTYKEMPESAQALVQDLANGGIVPESVYLKPEAVQAFFFQEENPELMQAAEAMGITPESLEENLTLGTDVAVPTQLAATHIMQDPARYDALKPDMRFDPSMPSEADFASMLESLEDAAMRGAIVDHVLAPYIDEGNQAISRHEARMEIAAPYIEQMRNAGHSESQAQAYGTVLAANAERMAPVFGLTPAEYLEQRFAGYHAMTEQEFLDLSYGGLDAMFENRWTQEYLQELGVKKGMSRVQRRKILQRELAYAWGKVSAQSVIKNLGKSIHKQLLEQYGPGFFASKEKGGVGLDVLGHEFLAEEKIASDHRSYADSDNDFFTEKILMTHEEFEASQMRNIKEALFQSEVESDAFKQWFGNSKVVDENGAPLAVYHGTGATIGDDFSFDYGFVGKNGSAEGYGFYFTSDKSVADGYQKKGGSVVSTYLSMQKPMPLKQKPFGKSVLKKILKRVVENEIVKCPDEVADYKDSFLSNYADTYSMSFDRALDVASSMVNDGSDTALDQIADIANVSGDKQGVFAAVRDVTGYDGVFSNGYGDLGKDGGKIYVAWFPEQIKSVYNRGTWDSSDPRILFQPANRGQSQAEAALERDVAAWKKTVDSMKEKPTGHTLMLTQTPLVMHLVGADFKELYAAPHVFDGMFGTSSNPKHNVHKNIDAAVLKQIPKALADPIAVFRDPRTESRMVFMLETVDANGATVVVPVEFSAQKGWTEVNLALSVYAKGHDGRVNSQWFWDNAQDIVYINKKKDRAFWKKNQRWLTSSGSNSLWVAASASGNKIRTEADLVKLREQYPTHYSRAAGTARGGMRKMADGRYVVGLFKRADASTILHETAHFWLEELREAARLETAPEWVHDAWGKLQAAYGFEGFLDGKDAEGVAAWTGVQERFAREFEAYAREGKAPSWELQSAFNKFRNWLTEIYRTVRKLLGAHGVSEEAREVFDVLLATEEEIALSQRRASENSVMDLLEEEVSPELRDRYARAVQKAYDNASAVIANRRLVEQRKAEKEFRALATEAVDANPTYRTLNGLRESGISFDVLKTSISEDIAYTLREKWRGGRGEGKSLFRKNGTLDDLLDVAAQFDEDSVQGLAAALMEMPTRAEAIDAEVQRRLAEWDSEYDAEVEYSSALDEALAIELEALTGKKQASPAQLRRQMEERAGVRKITEVEAEYKALKARLRQDARVAREAFKSGVLAGLMNEGAKRAKVTRKLTEERLRRAALGAAYRAKKERDTIVKRLRREALSKTVHDDYRQQILRILAHWQGLGTAGMVPREPAKLEPLMEFVGSHVSLFDEPAAFVPDFMAELGGRPAYASDLTMEQLREIDRVVRELANQGRAHGRMLSHRKKVEVAVVGGQCAEQMNKLSEKEFISERAGVMGTLRGALRKGLSSLTSMRFLARALDGFEKHGVNHDAWLHPLQEARSNELLHLRTVNALLEAAMRPIVEKNKKGITGAFRIEGVALPDKVAKIWGGLWDMDKVYSVALNMGNAGNLKALMHGYGWTEQDLRTITSRLTEAEWRSIEQIWEAIDSIYPLLNETVQTLKGVPLTKVEAQPFAVETADGQTITVRGGYYPLIFDTRLNDRSAENIATDELLNGMESVLRHPNPKSGMTKDRQGAKIPPFLSLSVIDRHVRDAVHYATHALPLRDVMMLFGDEKFKDAFVRAAGEENYKQLLPWLRGIARPDGERLDGMLKAMDWLARRGTMFALGANMRTALLQLTSMGNSWSEVGTENFFRAAGTILQSPAQAIRTIREKSAYMNERAKLMDDTLRREYDRMRASGVAGVRFMNVSYALDTVQKAQFALISSLDATVAFPTWLAAYDMAIADGMEENRAVAIADGAVVAAQGGSGPIDTPYVMRHAGLVRMLCPFMSFALADFNRKLETVRGLEEWRRTGNSAITPGVALRDFAFQWIMPVALVSLLVSLGRDGELPEAEDYAWEAAGFLTMGIPILRDMSRMAEDKFSDKGFAGGRSPLMFSGVGNLVNGIGHAITAVSEDSDRAAYLAIKELTNATGFALGLGTPQIWRTIEGTEAYFVDDKGGFLAPLLGKPHPRRD